MGSPAHFQPVPICCGPEGQINCGSGGEEVLAHALWGPRCLILLCFEKTHQKHVICWQQSLSGSLWALAWSWLLWLGSWRPNWKLRLLQSQQQPGLSSGPAQPSAQGERTDWPCEQGSCSFPTYSITKSLGKYSMTVK